MSNKSKTNKSTPQGFRFRGQQFTSAITVLFRMSMQVDLTDEEMEYAQELADLCPADEGELLDRIISANTARPSVEEVE